MPGTRIGLRRELAAELCRLDELGIDEVARDSVVRLGSPAVTLDHLLARLDSRGDHAGIRALAERGARDAPTFDAQKYEPLWTTPSEEVAAADAAVADWSHIELDVRWDDEDGEAREAARITGDAELLQATVTLQWEGTRPPDPRFRVTQVGLLGRAITLSRTWHLVDDALPGIAAWTMRGPVAPALFRTRTIRVECWHDEQRRTARRTLIATRGTQLAAALWIPFAVFTWVWIHPISPQWLAAPLSILGGVSGVLALLVRTVAWARLRTWIQSAFAIWERTSIVVLVGVIATIALPPVLVVVVTNDTGREILLDDGAVIKRALVREPFLAPGAPSWTLRNSDVACICGACPTRDETPACTHAPKYGVEHIRITCIRDGCKGAPVPERFRERVDGFTIDRPAGEFRRLRFEAGTIRSGFRLTWGGSAQHVRVDRDATDRAVPDSPVELAVLPPLARDEVFELTFDDEGATACTATTTAIATVDLDFAVRGAVELRSGPSTTRHTQTWRPLPVVAGAEPRSRVRACVGSPPLELSIMPADLPVGHDISFKFGSATDQPPTVQLGGVRISPYLPGTRIHVVELRLDHVTSFAGSAVHLIDSTLGYVTRDPPARFQVDKQHCTYTPDVVICAPARRPCVLTTNHQRSRSLPTASVALDPHNDADRRWIEFLDHGATPPCSGHFKVTSPSP